MLNKIAKIYNFNVMTVEKTSSYTM